MITDKTKEFIKEHAQPHGKTLYKIENVIAHVESLLCLFPPACWLVYLLYFLSSFREKKDHLYKL